MVYLFIILVLKDGQEMSKQKVLNEERVESSPGNLFEKVSFTYYHVKCMVIVIYHGKTDYLEL